MSFQRPAARRAPAAEPDWLTLGQAAKFLGVAQSTIRKWSDQGRLPAFYTPGGHRRFRRQDLEAFVERSGPGQHRGGPLVLVVDDDPSLREYMRLNLELAGYAVREAENGTSALAAVEDQAPDLVLLDVVMPGVDGWQILRQLEERHGSIPVIMFSGKVDGAAEAVERGASGFVGKPFDPEELLERAKQLVPV
ncbi:MAG TPA: response regulator [Gaiellaceae bacterium]|jgi:excisionase family DNA binding protein|nr:response regulator [Gaiellaceae bacterium]